jgi:hypothetical protein
MNDPTVMHLDFGAAKPARRPNETRYTLTDLSEDEIQDLAAGVVPRVVKAMAAGCLAMIDEDERKAARPEPRKRRSA